jgi:hypothetical protein
MFDNMGTCDSIELGQWGREGREQRVKEMNSREEVEPPCLAASAVKHNFMEIDIDPPSGLPGLLK